MLRAALLAAGITGAFCAIFTVLISVVVEALPLTTAIVLSFVSGFCGSLFARYILRG